MEKERTEESHTNPLEGRIVIREHLHDGSIFRLIVDLNRMIIIVVEYLPEDRHPLLHQDLVILVPYLDQQIKQLRDLISIALHDDKENVSLTPGFGQKIAKS